MSNKLAEIFRSMTPVDVQNVVDTPDTCISWVTPLDEVSQNPHLVSRGAILVSEAGISLNVAPKIQASNP